MYFQTVKQELSPLVCEGLAYARGQRQGEANRKQLMLCFNAFYYSELFDFLRPKHAPRAWGVRQLRRKAQSGLGKVLKRKAPEHLQFLEGLAQAANCALSDLLVMASIEGWLSHTQLSLGAGSALLVPTRFSATEEPILLKNLDLPYFFKDFQLIRQTQPTQGLRSLELSLLYSSGAHTGMNEAGVALCYNYAYNPNRPQAAVPIAIKIQQALQTCQSTAEVQQFFEQGQQEGSAIIGVVDGLGDIRLIEVNSHQVESKVYKDKILIMTNHYQTALLSPQDVPVNAYYHFQKGLIDLSGKRIRESSELRFDQLYQLTGTQMQFHPEELLKYAQDHGSSQQASDNSLCRHGDHFETSTSVLLRPRSRSLAYAAGSPCETPFKDYQWL